MHKIEQIKGFLCRLNGDTKKFMKRIILLICILGRKRWNLKLSIFLNRRKIKHEGFLGTYDFSSWEYNKDALFVLQQLSDYTNDQAGFDHLPSIFAKLSWTVKVSKRKEDMLKKGIKLVCTAVSSFLPALF